MFEQDKPRSFWMRNTQIPLDIVYINAARRDRARHGLPRLTQSGVCPAGHRLQYVLEVNAGEAKPLGLVKGEARHDLRDTGSQGALAVVTVT